MDNIAKTKPPTSISMPLVSRLDRLESLMNLLEDQKSVLRRGASSTNTFHASEKKCIPMGLAVKEAECKGSLLDRVEALEDRLVQLCVQLESRGVPLSQTSVVQAFLDSRSRVSHSYGEFHPSQYQNKQDSQVKIRSSREKKRPMQQAVFKQQTETSRDGNTPTTVHGPKKPTASHKRGKKKKRPSIACPIRPCHAGSKLRHNIVLTRLWRFTGLGSWDMT
ncbi:hypothetical protein Ancab_015731 [Ancistrocladus abbreviatus]